LGFAEVEAPELCKVVFVVDSLPDGYAFPFGSLESQKQAYSAFFLPDFQLTPMLSCDSPSDYVLQLENGFHMVFASGGSSAGMKRRDKGTRGDG
jgi:hypothetical protein